jgi:hypothetical protein
MSGRVGITVILQRLREKSNAGAVQFPAGGENFSLSLSL